MLLAASLTGCGSNPVEDAAAAPIPEAPSPTQATQSKDPTITADSDPTSDDGTEAPGDELSSEDAVPDEAAAEPVPVCRPTVIFLDPGHGGNLRPTAATAGGSLGIYSGLTASGGNEDQQVFDIAVGVAEILRSAGFEVVLGRTENPSINPVPLWQVGLLAETARDGEPADLAVSIHTDVRAHVGNGEIYHQCVGCWRENNDGSVRRYFENEVTAAASEQFARVFAEVREEFTDAPIRVTAGHTFSPGRNLGSHGTIPIVMLSGQGVPWVFNEFPRTTDAGLSAEDLQLAINSLAQATMRALPPQLCNG